PPPRAALARTRSRSASTRASRVSSCLIFACARGAGALRRSVMTCPPPAVYDEAWSPRTPMRLWVVVAESIFFRDLAYVFLAAVGGGALARLAGQPLVLGYVLGGILISPLTPGPAVSDLHTFELFAEIGVILLMFSVGIEFSLHDLLRVKWVALLGAPLGIALSVAMGMGVAALLGWPLLPGAVVGMVISVASTMVLARLLMDRGELHSRHGRVMIGGTLGRALLILVPAGYVAARIIPPLMTRVARMHSDEMFLLVALAVGLGTAALTQAAGLSLALGAFLAGLI